MPRNNKALKTFPVQEPTIPETFKQIIDHDEPEQDAVRYARQVTRLWKELTGRSGGLPSRLAVYTTMRWVNATLGPLDEDAEEDE